MAASHAAGLLTAAPAAPQAASLAGPAVGLLLGYTVLVLAIGGLAARASKGSTEEDYFVGGRTFGLVVVFFTYCSTMFSFWYFSGSGGFWYQHGVGFYAHVPWTLYSAVLLYYFGTRMWALGKRYGYITPGDMLAHRYESEALRVVSAVVGIGFTVPYVLLQIIGAGAAISAATAGAISYFWGTVIMASLILVYTFMGGSRAVAWTDVLQGFVFFALMWFIGIWACAVFAGGPAAMFERVLRECPKHLTLPGPQGRYTHWQWTSLWAFAAIAITSPGLWLRVYAARSARLIRLTAALSPLALTLGYIPTMLYAFAAIPDCPGLEGLEPNNLLMIFLAKHWAAMGVFVLLGAFAAGMSTADSLLLSTSAMATRDLYKRYVRPQASQGQLVWVGRLSVLLFTLGVWWMAQVQYKGLIIKLGLLHYGGCAQLIFPLTGCLYWRGATKAGSLAGVAVGVALLVLLDSHTTPFPWANALPVHPAFVALIGNGLVFVLVSRFTRRAAPETEAAFFGLFEQG